MINALFVTKRFSTYADVFLMLGLAQIIDNALRSTNQPSSIQLIDEGSRYRLQFKKPVNIELIKGITDPNLFKPVCGKKTDRSKIPTDNIFDVVFYSEQRKFYLQNRSKGLTGENAPHPPDPKTQNGVILTSMRHEKNHNELWQQGWELRDKYGFLVTSLVQAFSKSVYSSINQDVKTATDLFKNYTGSKLPSQISAVKIYIPTAVQGVNRVKADGNKTDAQKADWLILWLIANGLFSFGVSERVKIAEKKYDWRVVALEPKDISLFKYQAVLENLRKFTPPSGGHGIARFDAELVLIFCQKLLDNNESQTIEQPEDDLDIFKPANEFVRGFSGTHFGQKGQVYGVKEVFSLGLPSWIRPSNCSEFQEYHTVLKEHLYIIKSLSVEEGHSELLGFYREFITGDSWQSFFRFQISYAEYIVKRLADPKGNQPRLFSRTGLDIMTNNLTEITKDPSFLRIAKAINQATVYAGEVKSKEGSKKLDWPRTYGLAQRLSSQSSSKNDFIKELLAFLISYENENMRISEQLQKQGKNLQRVWPRKEDLDRLIELIDENKDTALIANLLIAYGYANWYEAKKSKKLDGDNDDATFERENIDDKDINSKDEFEDEDESEDEGESDDE